MVLTHDPDPRPVNASSVHPLTSKSWSNIYPFPSAIFAASEIPSQKNGSSANTLDPVPNKVWHHRAKVPAARIVMFANASGVSIRFLLRPGNGRSKKMTCCGRWAFRTRSPWRLLQVGYRCHFPAVGSAADPGSLVPTAEDYDTLGGYLA